MPKSYSEVFVSNSKIAPQVSRDLKKGLLRKLSSRVYTTNLKEKAEKLVRRHIWFLVEGLFPEAIIVDRTAIEHRPAEDGSIFIVSNKKRPVLLPGIVIYPRKGHGPLPEDKPFMDGLFLSCQARAYLENMRPSRARKGHVARTLTQKEIEEKLEDILKNAGVQALLFLRDEAKKISVLLDAEKEYQKLDLLIGSLLGTKETTLSSPLAIARSRGEPYDPKRLDLFQGLYESLARVSIEHRIISNASSALPFFEAYFSNFIEGTEFEIEEAIHIIFEGKIPKGRPADAHDILGTYKLVSDPKEMHIIPKDGDEFVSILKKRHAFLMQGRKEMHPGLFKTVPNRAGSTFFVAPELVIGTLKKGFKWIQGLDTAFKKAVYMMFLVSEVHPFDDGNGRCARIMMNAELIAKEEARIIIPTVFRNTYLNALRSLSHNGTSVALIRSLDFVQKYTSLIDWSSIKVAQKNLQETNAFEDAVQAEQLGINLIHPMQ